MEGIGDQGRKKPDIVQLFSQTRIDDALAHFFQILHIGAAQLIDLAQINRIRHLAKDPAAFVHDVALTVDEERHTNQKEHEKTEVDIAHIRRFGSNIDNDQEQGTRDAGERTDGKEAIVVLIRLLPHKLP